jgi:hypothetical protein
MRIYAGWFWLLLTPSLLTAAGQAPDTDKSKEPPALEPPALEAPALEAPAPRVLPAEGRGTATDVRCRTGDFGLPTVTLVEAKANFLKLKAERESLQAERLTFEHRPAEDASMAEENVKLRLRLSEVLTRLGTKMNQPPAPVTRPQPESAAKPPPRQSEKSPASEPAPPSNIKEGPAEPGPARLLDPLALAQVLFKAGNYEASLKAYRLIDLRGMKAEVRLPIQYLIATCLKRNGKTEAAAGIYREIANARGDENLAACAQWQLSTMRRQQEMLTQLDSIRQRRKALENNRP